MTDLNQVVVVAGFIGKTSQNVEEQKKVIQWKINTNKASAKAASRSFVLRLVTIVLLFCHIEFFL